MRSLVDCGMYRASGALFKTIETVAGETPLSCATSRKVTPDFTALRRAKNALPRIRCSLRAFAHLYHSPSTEASRTLPSHQMTTSGQLEDLFLRHKNLKLNVRNLRDVPTSTNGFDQENAGRHPARQNCQGSDLVSKRRTLSRCHFQIICDTALITGDRQFNGVFCCTHSNILGLRFTLQNAQRCEVVFHLLKCGEHRLAVIVDGLIVGRFCLFGCAPPASCVEQCFKSCSAHSPESTRTLKQGTRRNAFKSPLSRECDRRKVSCPGDSDLRIGCLHSSFGRGNIGSPLKQIGRQAWGNRRRRSIQRQSRQSES